MSKLIQSVLRDFRMEVAYKMKLLSDLFYVVFVVIVYYYVSRLVGDEPSLLTSYRCDYFSFVMVGLALANFLQASLQGYTENVRRFMVEGSLEAMFATPTSHFTLIVCSAVWPVLYALFKTVLQFAVAYLAFGLALQRMDLTSTLLSLLLSTIIFAALGVTSASILIVVKRGDPLNWLFIQLSHLLGGVLFPIEMLPDWARALSYLFPIHYALDSTRRAMLSGTPPGELLPELGVLALFAALLLLLSYFASVYLINLAKRSGVLSLF